jgi:hypothetical protein
MLLLPGLSQRGSGRRRVGRRPDYLDRHFVAEDVGLIERERTSYYVVYRLVTDRSGRFPSVSAAFTMYNKTWQGQANLLTVDC